MVSVCIVAAIEPEAAVPARPDTTKELEEVGGQPREVEA